MSAFYAIYHGPEGLKNKAAHAHSIALVLAEGLQSSKNQVVNQKFFDTLKIKPTLSVSEIRARAESKAINFRYFEDNQHVTICV
jgi:glycine dehydrogenase